MERKSCSCDHCANACTFKPGWLEFGDEKIIAEKMGLSVKELFDKYLLVDHYKDDDGNDFFGLSPCVTQYSPGGMFGYVPTGTCIFFNAERKCDIHSVAPQECQQYVHDTPETQARSNKIRIAQSWGSPEAKQLIRELLGKEPEPIRANSIFDLLEVLQESYGFSNPFPRL